MRILFYTDQPIMALGLESLFRAAALDLETSLQTDNLIEKAKANPPDILLLDFTQKITYAELAAIAAQVPLVKIVLWCDSISVEMASHALGLGVRGILMKNLPVNAITQCMDKVQSGKLWFEDDLAQKLFTTQRIKLTGRESQLVALVAQGLKNKIIATALGISEGTIKVYLHKLFPKIGVTNRCELAVWATAQLGYFDSDKSINTVAPRIFPVSHGTVEQLSPRPTEFPETGRNGFSNKPAPDPVDMAVAERVAKFLVDKANNTGDIEEEGSIVMPPINISQVAKSLDASTQSITQCLREFKNAGFVNFSPRFLRIYDTKGLLQWVRDPAA